MLRHSRRLATLASLSLAAGLLPALAAGPAAAASTDVVLSEVYGGGGNNGSTFKQDFIELRNLGTTAVDVSTWTVQYAGATGTTWQSTNLTGSIPAGGTYLVGEAFGAGGTTDLPTPNVTGTIAMSGTAGKVALVASRTACTGAACANVAKDLVGYGSAATGFEGTAPAPGTTNPSSVSRADGAADTDQNGADFTLSNPPTPAGGATGPARTPADADCGVAATAGLTPIGDVQGSGSATTVPADQAVQVEGIVVGDLDDVEAGGFFLQSAVSDTATATSDGIFVKNPAIGAVTLGQRVRAAGLVTEEFGVTTLAADDIAICASGQPLPAAAELPVPSDDATRERFEGMRVTVATPLFLTEHFNLDRFGEVVLAAGGPQVNATELFLPGSASATATIAANRLGRITLDDGRSASDLRPVPYVTADDTVRIGDRARLEDVVLTFGFGAWRLQPSDGDARDAASTTFDETNPRPATPANVGGTYKVGAFNVLNYFTTLTTQNSTARGATNATDFQEQEAKIVSAINLLGADVVALQEIENSAALGEDTDEATATLVAALNAAAGAGTWAFVPSSTDLPPAGQQDVITNAIIYKPARVTRVGRSRSITDEVNFDNAREPVAQTFSASGDVFTVVANHLKSKSGTGTGGNADTGQGAFNADRVGQARAVLAFAETLRAETGDSDVILLGDFNAYTQEDPVDVLRRGGFRDLVETRKPGDYSYVFDGQLGSLDHALSSISLSQKVTGVDVWNINSPEPDAYQYDAVPELYAPDQFRSSDHDPVVVGLDLGVERTTAYDVQVLGINDFHGRLQQPNAGRGGAAFLADAINDQRALNRNTVLASAGDNIGASPFESAVAGDAPAIEALDAMGLEVTSVGNHEFDRGYADLAGRVANLAGFPFLGANVVNETPELPSTHTVTLADGVTVGFIGVTTEQTGTLVSPSGIVGITFADIVASVDAAAAALQDGSAANGEADVLVLLAHEGPTAAASSATDCASLYDRQDAFGTIARDVTPSIDAIIAGHTHVVVDCELPQRIKNGVVPRAAVRPVLEAGEYGQFLDRLVFSWNPVTQRISNIRTDVLPVVSTGANANTADPVVARIVADAVANASVLGRPVIGSITADIRRAFTSAGAEDRGSESPLGNLIADVQLEAANRLGQGVVDIAFMNPGGLRTDLLFARQYGTEAPGEITFGEAATVQPFANTLFTLTLTGAQVKQVLEQQFQPAGASRPFLALGVSEGFFFRVDAAAPAGSRISGITLNGTPIDPAGSYRVVTNSFLASGGDNFGALAGGSNRVDTGLDDLRALVEYFGRNSPVSPAGLVPRRAAGAAVEPTPTPTTTPGPTDSPSPTTTASPTGSPAPTGSASPTGTATPAPTGSASPSPTVTPTAGACTVTPVIVLERTSINATGAAGVSVRGTAGATVDLFAYTRPSSTYRLVRSGVVGTDGTLAFPALRPPANTRLYAQTRGCTTDVAADSVVLNVRTTLSLFAKRNGPRSYTFTGDSLPARPGGLIVSLYRVTADGRQVLTSQTRASATTGDWSIDRVFTGTGRFGFVVRTGQDLQNAPGTSNVRPTLVF